VTFSFRWWTLGVVAGIASASQLARAQDTREEVFRPAHRNVGSPQNFAFEFRFSPFMADVDTDPSLRGQTPFAAIFGSSKTIMFGAEVDWQALRIPHFGTLGAGAGISYAMFSGNAKITSTGLSSGETTTLEIYPMYVVAVLRADALWREARVPLVPYVKLGPALALWRASNTLGTSYYQGAAGRGYTLGSEFAVGVGLNINMLDDIAARSFDEDMGVNNTYLFGEWTRSDLTGLGFQADPLRVGGTYWTLGISFEF
jgi:hypothetical protein